MVVVMLLRDVRVRAVPEIVRLTSRASARALKRDRTRRGTRGVPPTLPARHAPVDQIGTYRARCAVRSSADRSPRASVSASSLAQKCMKNRRGSSVSM